MHLRGCGLRWTGRARRGRPPIVGAPAPRVGISSPAWTTGPAQAQMLTRREAARLPAPAQPLLWDSSAGPCLAAWPPLAGSPPAAGSAAPAGETSEVWLACSCPRRVAELLASSPAGEASQRRGGLELEGRAAQPTRGRDRDARR